VKINRKIVCGPNACATGSVGQAQTRPKSFERPVTLSRRKYMLAEVTR